MELIIIITIVVILYSVFAVKIFKRNNWVCEQRMLLGYKCLLYSVDKILKGEECDYNQLRRNLGLWSYDKMLWSFNIKDIALMSEKPYWTRLIMEHEPDSNTVELVKYIQELTSGVKDIREGIRKELERITKKRENNNAVH